eukprot:TRINITY_DN3888_c0_g1_i2.p1 TRINITY_DN3888_c0_g1~~TRINITY_DN3888_c0_g1_i2.p1  ORF type:complete len:198 (-),score=65.10 TRINITY_DN3888_c0_g1_i2:34-627(-)
MKSLHQQHTDSGFTVVSYEESKSLNAFFFEKKEKVKQCRVSRACESCKIGHLSCNNERPCQRCIKSGKEDECTDNSEQKKRSKRKREKIPQVSERVESFINSTISLDSDDESSTSSGLNSLAGSINNEEFEDWYSSVASKSFEGHDTGFAVLDSGIDVRDGNNGIASSFLMEASYPQYNTVMGCDVVTKSDDKNKRK